MKRATQDYVGRPLVEKAPVDVVGARRPQTSSEVASFLNARGEAADSDSSVVSEFAEFLAVEADPDHPFLVTVDPVFKERLRRRLWRLHLLTRSRGPSGEAH